MVVKKIQAMTRMQAERVLGKLRHLANADFQPFMEHANYHVRVKAWKMMGSPLPEKASEANNFLATLLGKKLPEEDARPAFFQSLQERLKIQDLFALTVTAEP